MVFFFLSSHLFKRYCSADCAETFSGLEGKLGVDKMILSCKIIESRVRLFGLNCYLYMKTMEYESSLSEGVYFSPLFFFSTLHYTFNSIFTAFFIFFFLALRRNRLGSVM